MPNLNRSNFSRLSRLVRKTAAHRFLLRRFGFLFAGLAALTPLTALAARACVPPPAIPPENFCHLTLIFIDLLNGVIPFIFGLAVIFFIVGIVKLLANPGNEDAMREGKNIVLYGVIILFVMVSVWGFVNMLYYTFFS
jgi:hypothetical protein